MKWKSVKDSKPKDGQLVYGCNEKIVPGFLCNYHEWADCFYPREDATIIMPLAVTHWLPLPKTVAQLEINKKVAKLVNRPQVMICNPNEEQKDPKKRGRKPKRKKA